MTNPAIKQAVEAAPIETVAVVGLGYVGLPTAATIATRGVEVIGVDINAEAVETINRGQSHIVETDLDVVLQAAVQSGRLKATTSLEPADVFVIAVPTPIDDGKKANLGAVEAAFRAVAPVLRPGNLIVLESTSPVGTTERMTRLCAELRPDLSFPHQDPEHSDILVSYCPERILPGHTLRELVENSRTIGGLDRQSAERTKTFYELFCAGELFLTSCRTAEFVKLTENAYRDVNIAFANELSMLCGELDVDVHDVIAAANRHPRVNVLQPGPGVGGHCIPVDPWFIVEAQPETARLIRTAREVNEQKTAYVYALLKRRVQETGASRVAILGLSYKPDVDDLRESPALRMAAQAVEERLADLIVVEPNIEALPPSLWDKGVRLASLETALSEADLAIVLVAHKEFAASETLSDQREHVIDTVGLWR